MDCIDARMVEEDVAPAPTQVSQPSDSTGSDTVVFHADTFMILLSRKINNFMLGLHRRYDADSGANTWTSD